MADAIDDFGSCYADETLPRRPGYAFHHLSPKSPFLGVRSPPITQLIGEAIPTCLESSITGSFVDGILELSWRCPNFAAVGTVDARTILRC